MDKDALYSFLNLVFNKVVHTSNMTLLKMAVQSSVELNKRHLSNSM